MMKHSIALVTGATSGLGYAAARLLAAKGYREVIITGRSLVGPQQAAGQLAAETKTQVFTPLELDLNDQSTFTPPSPRSSSKVGRSISCCSMQGWFPLSSACSPQSVSKPLRPRSLGIIDCLLGCSVPTC